MAERTSAVVAAESEVFHKEFSKLVRQRASVKAHLTIQENFIKKYADSEVVAEGDVVKLRAPKLDELFNKFMEIHHEFVDLFSQYEIAIAGEDQDSIMSELEKFEDSFYTIKAEFNKYMGSSSYSASSNSSLRSINVSSRAHLDNNQIGNLQGTNNNLSIDHSQIHAQQSGSDSIIPLPSDENPVSQSNTQSQQQSSNVKEDEQSSLNVNQGHQSENLSQGTQANASSQVVHSNSNNRPHKTYYKLPEMKLPIFNGEHNTWLKFRDTFEAVIIQDPDMSMVQKFYYLSSHLGPKVENIIERLDQSSDGFNNAWARLKERFDNKRLLIEKHIASLFNLLSVTNADFLGLRKLLDDANAHISAIQALGQPLQQSDIFINHLVSCKLDSETHRLWENEKPAKVLATWHQLNSFLEKRCCVLEAISNNQNFIKSNTSKFKSSTTNKTTKSMVTANYSKNCPVCAEEHPVYRCSKFKAMSLCERFETVKKHNLCINCLRQGHFSQNCSLGGCPQNGCGKKHNSLLHESKSNNQSDKNNIVSNHQATSSSVQGKQSAQQNATVSNVLCNCLEIVESEVHSEISKPQLNVYNLMSAPEVILTTAIILIKDKQNNYIEARVLLDSCSQSHFITKDLSKKLKHPIQHSKLRSVSSISGNKASISGKVATTIKSRFSNYTKEVECLIVDKITDNLPNQMIDLSSWSIPKYVSLADYQFNIPSGIDALFGAEIFSESLEEGKIQLDTKLPILINSAFGWLVSGKINVSQNFMININQQSDENKSLNQQLKQFWELETTSTTHNLTKEEEFCENHFINNVVKLPNGKYQVSLPFLQDPGLLGKSQETAVRRFHYLERKFAQNPEIKCQYVDFMNQYLNLNHMKLSEDNTTGYFIPHHAVVKESSTTTRLRVVFDASCNTSTNISLNDIMANGPVVQQDLFTIIVRFRKHLYAMTADIEKMYRTINVNPVNTVFQKIVWRSDTSEPLKTYELTTVTYGTKSAPYLATRVLKQISLDNKSVDPVAAKVIADDFYVDDLLTGHNNLEMAKSVQQNVITILKQSGMHLRKWSSNSPELLEDIPITDQEFDFTQMTVNDTIKTLGLVWQPITDQFTFKIHTLNKNHAITKRYVLSEVTKLFDPLGLLAPVIIVAKIFIQRLWQSQCNWDDEIPQPLLDHWQNYYNELHDLYAIKINRCLVIENAVKTEIHGFCDASESAYGAVIYLKTIDANQTVKISLVCSKSRVAPVQSVSVARLELCAAQLLAELVQKVIQALAIENVKVYLWSDSTITLNWIRIPPNKLKIFVANRVSDIQQRSENFTWRYVPTKQNPADHVSRGVMPSQLKDLHIWWNGPMFLHQDEHHWPILKLTTSIQDVDELKSTDICLTIVKPKGLLNIEHFDSFKKLIRATALVFKAINKFKSLRTTKNNQLMQCENRLNKHELDEALKFIIKDIQNQHFFNEIELLSKGKGLSPKSPIFKLSPILDSNGLLCISGRLSNSQLLTENQKHPWILPKNCHFVTLIIRHEHLSNYHAGVMLTLSCIRQRYWPINAVSLIKKEIYKCVNCFKSRPKLSNQIMGNLPMERIEPQRPFNVVGTDYCGPFYIKCKHTRNKVNHHKIYVCIFICFVTKAVHLEMVLDMTSEAFLACLRRFVARRGKPTKIFSDNGTNYVGANNDLKQLQRFVSSIDHEVSNWCAEERIIWKFIPARSPNHGGLWESAVKIFKNHFKRTLNNKVLAIDEFLTCITVIEGIMNSRPLTPLSSDPRDITSLTPGHFLTGGPLNTIIDHNITTVNDNRLTKWKQLVKIQQVFWKRFNTEYLHLLQQRVKWHQIRSNIQPNDMVLLYEENLPVNQWLLGRVKECHHGSDGMVRVVSVTTKNGVVKRSINKICKLPIEH